MDEIADLVTLSDKEVTGDVPQNEVRYLIHTPRYDISISSQCDYDQSDHLGDHSEPNFSLF